MFTDTLLARKDNDIELPELLEVYQFLDFMLGFISLYLKDFPSLLNAVFPLKNYSIIDLLLVSRRPEESRSFDNK
jgi:hypothetical protein